MAMNFKYGSKDVILLQYLEEKIKRNPVSSLFAMLAYFYLETDRIPEALSVAQRGVIAHPNYSTGHVVLAMAMERARLFTDAKKELLKARDINPGSKIADRLIAELEKNEQADEIGKKLAEQFRQNSGKDIMKTVEETIRANRSKMDWDDSGQKPSPDDLMIPGLDIIVGEELSKPRREVIRPDERDMTPPAIQDSQQTPLEQASSKDNAMEHATPFDEVQPETKSSSSSIAKAIIDKVVREVAQQVPPHEPEISPDHEKILSMEPPPPSGTKETPQEPLEQAENSINNVNEFLDLEDLARKLNSARPIKPEDDASNIHDENLSIELTPEIVTDTLAMIFEQQGQIKAAIEAYNILIKKKPEQADYYEKKIANLTQLQQPKSPGRDAED